MGDPIDPEDTITIDFTPQPFSEDDQGDIQDILDERLPGYVLVVPDGSDAWLIREFVDRGIPPDEVEAYLAERSDPLRITLPRESLSPPHDELARICDALADPVTAGDDVTVGNEDDEVPDEGIDLRFCRVRLGRVDDGVEPFSVPTLPVVVSVRARRVIAIS